MKPERCVGVGVGGWVEGQCDEWCYQTGVGKPAGGESLLTWPPTVVLLWGAVGIAPHKMSRYAGRCWADMLVIGVTGGRQHLPVWWCDAHPSCSRLRVRLSGGDVHA
jgi:hypothetical protein